MDPSYPIAAIAIGGTASLVAATIIGGIVARAGFPSPAGDRRIGCLDGLRGYLALAVLIHHFVLWMQVARLGGHWSPPSVNVLNSLGSGAVALFFMTTGLVFYPRILAGFRRTWWPAVVISRLFRLVPAIALSIAVVTVIVALRTGGVPDARFPAAVATWVTGWGEPALLGFSDSGRVNAFVLWSLWYEWLFYLVVLPACALTMDVIGDRVPRWAVPATLLLATLLVRRRLPLGGWSAALPYFAVGMLAFEAHRCAPLRDRLKARWVAFPALLSLAIGMMSAPTPDGIPQLLLYGFFFAAVACGNDLLGLLSTDGALVLGACSFSIYLLHGAILSLVFVEGEPALRAMATEHLPWLLPPIAVVMAVLTPMVYLAIEGPAIAAGRRMAVRLSQGRPLVGKPEFDIAP